jgi:hypothetical protein
LSFSLIDQGELLMSRLQLLMLSLMVLLSSCSEGTSFNQIFVSKAEKETLISLMTKAQLAYDRGEFKGALVLAEKARDLSPKNEDIAILLGYINLSLAGMDTFAIARAMVDATNTGTKSESKTTLAESNSSSSATIFLDAISTILNIGKEDIETLGTISEDQDKELFADYPVLLPESAKKARRSGLTAFYRISAAIASVCPFVDAEAKSASDERHSEANCEPTEFKREKAVVAHFLWAFAHIAEAAVFYSALQYKNEGATVANIQARANQLQAGQGSLSLTEYASHMVSLADAVTKVYAIDDSASQFSAIVSNLTVAGKAFGQIANIPSEIKKSLNRALASITATNNVDGTSADQKQSSALKAQLNKSMSNELAAKIAEEAADNPAEFAANKDDLCSAYSEISGVNSTLDECAD